MRAATTRFALRNPNARRGSALICLGLFLTLQVVAASGPLHRVLHPDATSPTHHCVITLLAQGQLHAPGFPAIAVVFVAALCFFLPRVRAAIFSSFEYRLSPSRAPPRS